MQRDDSLTELIDLVKNIGKIYDDERLRIQSSKKWIGMAIWERESIQGLSKGIWHGRIRVIFLLAW